MSHSATNIIEDFRGDTLVSPALLRAITKRIVENIHPEKIILFGSYAYGEPTLDSDDAIAAVKRVRKFVRAKLGLK